MCILAKVNSFFDFPFTLSFVRHSKVTSPATPRNVGKIAAQCADVAPLMSRFQVPPLFYHNGRVSASCR